MPRISAYYGIVVTMYWRDHPPGHFHASYAGQVAAIGDRVTRAPRRLGASRALRLVKEWAELHQAERRDNWDRARAHEALLSIDPLP